MLMKTFAGLVAGFLAIAGPVSSTAMTSPPAAAAAQAGISAPQSGNPCTTHSAGDAGPGAVVCIGSGSKSKRLKISKGGTADKPMTYDGKGQTVGGLDIDADNVIVQNYTMDKPSAPGIEVHGTNVTVQNNTVTAPHGGDGDGMRFFGNKITIKNNTVSKTRNTNGHADCMQTFATGGDDVASQDLTIDGNKCQDIDNMCLMAEGPNSEAGDGSGEGVSENWTFSNNYCNTNKASQELMVDDVQHLTVTGNTWVKGVDHAIGLQNKSTYAHVKDNKLDPSIDCEVGMDSSSKKGYEGPASKCDP